MKWRLIEKARKCHRYRDLDSAIFLLSAISSESPEYRLIYSILLYENGELSRAVFHLTSLRTTTALFYKALAQKGLKKYTEAISSLNMILDNRTETDESDIDWFSGFFIDREDTEFFENLLGELHVLKGQSHLGIARYRSAMAKSPLIAAATGLYEEDQKMPVMGHFYSDPIYRYYQELFSIKEQICAASGKLAFREESQERGRRAPNNDENGGNRNNPVHNSATGKEQSDHLLPLNYTENASIEDISGRFSSPYFRVPFFSSYFIAKTASALARFGFEDKSLLLFREVRERDPCFIEEMDGYSTMLWKHRNENLLGLLAKEFMASHPDHQATWAIIGNHYSLRAHNKECAACFKRSIQIRETAYVYTLLGFESNTKNQFIEAQEHFKASLSMLNNNDRALFGLGISYAETYKTDSAALYFKRALEINPGSLHMIAYLSRFYVRNKEYDKAFDRIKQVLFMRSGHALDNYNSVVEYIENNMGSFQTMEELIICELAELLFYRGLKAHARRALEAVECRTSSYYSKKALIENTSDD